jgi:uncharacterized protein YlxP (DUF503 family)
MVVGILHLELALPASHSLKGKRAALRPLIAALTREFSASVAEVADQDAWQRAVLGVCIASSDRRHADRVLQAVLRRAEEWNGEAVLQSTSMELINVAPG